MNPTNWRKSFDEKFPHKVAEVIDDFGSTVKSDFKSFITSLLVSLKDEVGKVKEDYPLKGKNVTEFEIAINWANPVAQQALDRVEDIISKAIEG